MYLGSAGKLLDATKADRVTNSTALFSILISNKQSILKNFFMIYTIYNHANKSLVYDRETGTPENGYRDMKILKFKTKKSAEAWKDNDLSEGNYYDHPHTVYEIIKSK